MLHQVLPSAELAELGLRPAEGVTLSIERRVIQNQVSTTLLKLL